MNSGLNIDLNETALTQRYSTLLKRRIFILTLLGVGCILGFFVFLAIGGETLSLREVLQGLLHPYTSPPAIRVIIWQLRLPVALTAVIAGAGLAIAGSMMQLALNNPLAEPFTLGLSSAAGFGAALVLVLGSGMTSILGSFSLGMATSISAFCWSILVVILIGLIGKYRGMRPETIALVGIAIHFTFSSLLAFTQYSANVDQLQSLVFWLLGSVQRTSWTQVTIDAIIMAIVVPLLLSRIWLLTNLASFGELAGAMGVRVAKARFLILFAAAMLAGSVTATVGVVGFVGLVAPHIARLLVGEDQRFSLCASATCGILIMLVASIASQTIIPGAVLPIGMLTALLGVPFFLWQILKKGKGVA
ncbi:Vitamin B12 import system permease protein BtuC [Halomonadaceae bacterium LMG 33818]|uniref:FecCD family ABC transporter permease n=1 Tax=Cernens ardua TaxID=3402176 RepID=UPI003EDBC938